jgi:hypothetical protein
MSPLTIFLSRLIGLFTLILSASMLLHRQTSIALISAFVFNRPVMFLLGMITLAAGLAIVLAHNRWSGGALTIVVTVIGWLVLARGITLLFLPPQTLESAFESLRFEDYYFYYAAIPFFLGLYLTLMGFSGHRR